MSRGWQKESHRHSLATRGIKTRESLIPKKNAKVVDRYVGKIARLYMATGELSDAEEYFYIDSHNLPLIMEMMENPEYFETKKGIRWDIVLMTTQEYEEMLRRGFSIKSKKQWTMEDVRDRISEENLRRVLDIMKKEKMNMPYIEYNVRYWDGKKHIIFSQEGHHRMLAANRLGLKGIPVFLMYPSAVGEFNDVKRYIPPHVLRKVRGPKLTAKGNNIKEVVNDPKWQKLRISMKGTWQNKNGANKENLEKLKKYLGDHSNPRKLRQVHNYLGALRGVKDQDIVVMRKKIKEIRK